MSENVTMSDNNQDDVFHDGSIVTGTITKVETDKVLVDFGYKCEGAITRKEWSAVNVPSLQDIVAVGDSVRVAIESLDEEPALSRKAAVDDTVWQSLRADLEAQRVFTVHILAVVKGGLVTDVTGLRAFLPASLVDVKYVEDLNNYVMQPLDVVISELDEADRRLILSHRHVIELDEVKERAHRIETMQPGDVVNGTVARLTPFGAFVDLGGVDGLLHVSEMSWSRVNRPEDVVQVGDHLDVTILRVDPESGRVSLSMKGNRPSPWSNIASQFHVGDIVAGEVKRLSSFGAFIEVAPGIEGLVHVSQIADRRVAQPSDVLQPGQQVQVKILDMRPEEERMALSIREAKKESAKREEKSRVNNWADKQTAEPASTTLGDLFGDLLRDKFK